MRTCKVYLWLRAFVRHGVLCDCHFSGRAVSESDAIIYIVTRQKKLPKRWQCTDKIYCNFANNIGYGYDRRDCLPTTLVACNLQSTLMKTVTNDKMVNFHLYLAALFAHETDITAVHWRARHVPFAHAHSQSVVISFIYVAAYSHFSSRQTSFHHWNWKRKKMKKNKPLENNNNNNWIDGEWNILIKLRDDMPPLREFPFCA